MSNANRIARRGILKQARKAGRRAYRDSVATMIKSGLDAKTILQFAAMKANAVKAAMMTALVSATKLTKAERDRLQAIKEIRDKLVLDWSPASPSAGPCGECGEEAQRRWNGVGKMPDGTLLEGKNVCAKCAEQVEMMAQEVGAHAGEV